MKRIIAAIAVSAFAVVGGASLIHSDPKDDTVQARIDWD